VPIQATKTGGGFTTGDGSVNSTQPNSQTTRRVELPDATRKQDWRAARAGGVVSKEPGSPSYGVGVGASVRPASPRLDDVDVRNVVDF
jgi:hypothetical protein